MQSTLVLIGGLNGSAAEMKPLLSALRGKPLGSVDLLGHGGRTLVPRITFCEMVNDIVRQLDEQGTNAVHLLGYSFGAYVALGVALRSPERVRSVIGVAAKCLWSSEFIRHVVHLLDPDRLSRPGNPRQYQLAAAHDPNDWRQVALANREMIASFEGDGAPLTEEQLSSISTPVMIMSGEADALVSAAEARHLVSVLGNARLALWPGLAHPLSNVPLSPVVTAIDAFIAEVEDGSFAPGAPLAIERPPASLFITGGEPAVSRNLRATLGPARS